MINPDVLARAAPQNLTMVIICHICALAPFGLYIGFRSVWAGVPVQIEIESEILLFFFGGGGGRGARSL